MLVPMKWLNEYVDAGTDAAALARKLTFSGTKAEGIKDLGAGIENVVTARIAKCARHPNADKLLVTEVDAGARGAFQIITGAPNVKEGDVVPVALDKSRLPNGTRIRTTTMRGVDSCGMMCSIQELCLSKYDWPDAAEDGIFILPPGTPLGVDIREALGLDDAVVEFEITPNRPDCLGIVGVAREAAATLGRPLRLPESLVGAFAGYGARGGEGGEGGEGGAKASQASEAAGAPRGGEAGPGPGQAGGAAGPAPGQGGGAPQAAQGGALSVRIDDPDLCPRYTARMATGVTIRKSPEWMASRLRNAGVRPINNIVDITNYVMLETGQPMHAFDRNFLTQGSIVVRRARPGEGIRTLDGQDRALDGDMLVIADGEKPVAVAGVMGGENSEIKDQTTEIVFEAANFAGVSVRRTAQRLGMRTEASSRFEKGLDPEMTRAAADRAVELVELLGAGRGVAGAVDAYPGAEPPVSVAFEPARINALLGTALSEEFMLGAFARLGFGYDAAARRVLVPSYRRDVAMMADLAEEAARFYDYNNIPVTLGAGTAATVGARTPRQTLKRLASDTVAACGYSEIYTDSFQSPKAYDRLRLPEGSPLRDAVRIANPMGEDVSLMRTTTLPDMLAVIAENASRRIPAAAFFEVAHTYHPRRPAAAAGAAGAPAAQGAPRGAAGAAPSQEERDLAALDPDGLLPEQRAVLTLGAYGEGSGFFEMKGAIEELFAALGIEGARFRPCQDMGCYHPGRAAYVEIKNAPAGHFGEVHPEVAEAFECPARTCAGAVSLDEAFRHADLARQYRKLPKQPPVARDLAFVVDRSVPYASMVDIMRKAAGKVLESVEVFDVYTGPQVPEGKKSMAFSLLLRDPERTLTDEEANALIAKVVGSLGDKVRAELRSQ